MNVLISVIVPVYNVKQYLEKCITSILNQTYKNFEIILVDDGSTDGSGELCDTLEKLDTRIKAIHKKNGGLTSARVAGKAVSIGRYILFIDSDDYIEDTMLEKMVYQAERKAADIVICDYYVVNQSEKNAVQLPTINCEGIEEISKNYILPILGRISKKGYRNLPGFVCIRLYSSKLLSEECFVSEREYYSEDDILNLVVALKAKRIAAVHEPLYNYVQRKDSLTYQYRENVWDMVQKRYYYCKDYEKRYGYGKEDMQRVYFNGFSGIMKNVDNIVQGLGYKAGKKELVSMTKSESYEEIIKKINFNLMGKSQKIVYILLRMRNWRWLYKFRKSRLMKG